MIVPELEKEDEEDEEDQTCVTDAPSLPPSSALSPDSSHPYYDVARHGIIQVSGQYLKKKSDFLIC